jgi:hypothetical protein
VGITSSAPKPVDELTEADLRAFPMWEYALDEEDTYDETFVRPLELASVPLDSWSIQIAARYWLRSGAEYFGCADVSLAADPQRILPQFIVVGGKSVALPYPPAADAIPDVDLGIDLARHNLPKALGLPIEDILPAKFQLLVLVEGEVTLRVGTVV